MSRFKTFNGDGCIMCFIRTPCARGFYTSPFHFLKELSTDETTGYFLTAGAGINLKDVRIDIAGQLGKRTFTEPEAERDYEASIKSVLGTISYQFDLF